MRSIYFKCTCIGAAISFAAAAAGGVFFAQSFKETLRILSDGFFTAGVLVAGAGAILYAANGGIFDIFGYVSYIFFARIVRALKLQKARIYADFYEYKGAKQTRRRALPLFITGAAYAALSSACLALYYM